MPQLYGAGHTVGACTDRITIEDEEKMKRKLKKTNEVD
jgi:hypothetical protein